MTYDRLVTDVRIMMGGKPRGFGLTTMIDLYGLPGNFPGIEAARRETDPYRKVAILEEALVDDLCKRLPFLDRSCIFPYLQLHEFEALLLAQPEKLNEEFPEHAGAIDRLAASIAGLEPERINDGATTAPSKRIMAHVPVYTGRKAFAGPRVAGMIGLPVLRQRLPHFDAWLRRLESLGQSPV